MKKTSAEIDLLFFEYEKTKDVQLRNDILVHYLYVAEIVAKKFIGRGVEYDDLYQVASVALVRTIERYEPGRGLKFTTFATPSLVGEVKNYFRDKSRLIRVSRRDSELLVQFSKVREKLLAQGSATPEDIANEMNITQERVLELMETLSTTAGVTSLEAATNDESGVSLDQFVGREDESFRRFEDREFIKFAMSKLDDREKFIITERFVNGNSQREVARRMGVSQMHISRYEKKILKKMQDLL